jgi:hypothetical protein
MHQQLERGKYTYVSPGLRAGDMRYLASTPCAPILRMPLLFHTVAPTHATNACHIACVVAQVETQPYRYQCFGGTCRLLSLLKIEAVGSSESLLPV